MTVCCWATGVAVSRLLNVSRRQLGGTALGSPTVVESPVGMNSQSGLLSRLEPITVVFAYWPRFKRAPPASEVSPDTPCTRPRSNASTSLPVRGGSVFGPAVPQLSTTTGAVPPAKVENKWSAPIAMLSIMRARCALLPHRVGVLNVLLPYCVTSSRLKLPVSGSSQLAMRWPLGPCLRHES